MLLQRLQLLAGLEAHGLTGRNGNFRASARIAPDACLARLDVEDAEAAQFDTVALLEGLLHRFEDGLYRHLSFGFSNAGPIHDFVDDVQLDQDGLLAYRISQPHDRIEFIPMSSNCLRVTAD